MPYSPYASEEYYKECYTGTLIPEDEQRKALIQASRHIDTLTYNRIVSQGFSNLTEYQQEIPPSLVSGSVNMSFFPVGMVVTSGRVFTATLSSGNDILAPFRQSSDCLTHLC